VHDCQIAVPSLRFLRGEKHRSLRINVDSAIDLIEQVPVSDGSKSAVSNIRTTPPYALPPVIGSFMLDGLLRSVLGLKVERF